MTYKTSITDQKSDMDHQAKYDLIAEDWIKHRSVLPKKDALLFSELMGLLPEQATILDLGCGSGTPIAATLYHKGHTVIGVDRSEKLLHQARQQLPNATFIQSDLESLHIRSLFNDNQEKALKNVRAVICWDALFHLPRHHQAELLKEIASTISSGVHLLITSGGLKTDHPPFTDLMFGVEFYYDAFPIPKLILLCDSIGLKVISQSMLNTPDGKRDKGRVGLLLQKA